MKKALVVIDMQKDFIDGALGSPQAQAIVPKVVDKVKTYASKGEKIILTMDTHKEDYMETQEGEFLPVPHCLYGTDGWNITEALRNLFDISQFTTFCKETFGSIELAQALKGYDEIELVGLVSSICVISNALLIKAYWPEAKITVDAACTAGVSDDDYKASLCVMRMCHINIINEGGCCNV